MRKLGSQLGSDREFRFIGRDVGELSGDEIESSLGEKIKAVDDTIRPIDAALRQSLQYLGEEIEVEFAPSENSPENDTEPTTESEPSDFSESNGALAEQISQTEANFAALIAIKQDRQSSALLVRAAGVCLSKHYYTLREYFIDELLDAGLAAEIEEAVVEIGADFLPANGGDLYDVVMGECDQNSRDRYTNELKKLGLYKYISHEIGADVGEDLSAGGRQKLVEYLAKMGSGDFSRFGRISRNIDDFNDRTLFLEAFLATEFGDDLGDILLSLGEKNEPGFFEMVNDLQNLRKSGEKIANVLAGGDEKLKQALSAAFIKRATELLALADEEGVDSVAETLRQITAASSEINNSLGGVFELVEDAGDYITLRSLVDDNRTTLTFRPSGNNARIGMTVRVPMAQGKAQRLNIRLDREKNGALSLDFGGTERSANLSDLHRSVGEALTRGESSLARRRATQSGQVLLQESLHGYHVRETFSSIGEVSSQDFCNLVTRVLMSLEVVDSKAA